VNSAADDAGASRLKGLMKIVKTDGHRASDFVQLAARTVCAEGGGVCES
jgi:hypothetical protein